MCPRIIKMSIASEVDRFRGLRVCFWKNDSALRLSRADPIFPPRTVPLSMYEGDLQLGRTARSIP